MHVRVHVVQGGLWECTKAQVDRGARAARGNVCAFRKIAELVLSRLSPAGSTRRESHMHVQSPGGTPAGRGTCRASPVPPFGAFFRMMYRSSFQGYVCAATDGTMPMSAPAQKGPKGGTPPAQPPHLERFVDASCAACWSTWPPSRHSRLYPWFHEQGMPRLVAQAVPRSCSLLAWWYQHGGLRYGPWGSHDRPPSAGAHGAGGAVGLCGARPAYTLAPDCGPAPVPARCARTALARVAR